MFLHIKRLREQRSSATAEYTPATTPAARSAFRHSVAKKTVATPPLEADLVKLSRTRPRTTIFEVGGADQLGAVDDDVRLEREDELGTGFDEAAALNSSPQALAILGQYRRARTDFGMARLRLGSYLHLIRENKLWQGLAENWEAFVAGENLNLHAARQYISVAKTFIFEMDLPEEVLGKLSVAGISALEKAGRVINDGNREEVFDVLTSLSEKDAMQRIIEMSSGEQPSADKPTLRVLRLLKEFYEMPPDLQAEFLGKVGGRKRRLEDDIVPRAPRPSSPAMR